ncbi:glutathione-dependent reductase [Corynebacterium sp. LK19]|nr:MULTISPECIES: glutathione S-transferase C-terminal domain-containing protein [unclassified Corynebacterium]TXS59195.1 glutathione-dependent reductase [Corynebacterium sp. LK19]TXS86448.1 glutathione-dependent reductase [Corynebacterium sp. LK10]
MIGDMTTKDEAKQVDNANHVEDSSHSTGGVYSQEGKDFNRDTRYINDRIVKNGREIGEGIKTWPVEAGRYRLVAARACPWAHRTLIVRRLLGLEDAISVGIPGPVHDARSWTFDKGPGGRDEILGYERLQEVFLKRFPDYQRGITVPAIVDIESGEVVTNDFPWITLDFITEWVEFHRDGAPDLYPEEMREEMDELMQFIYTEINNGVYRCGFAGSQESYDKAYDRLFSALDKVSERLETRRYLMGDHITEADIRLYTTLIRFDAVYHGHFKCNRNKISEMPVLYNYLRDLFQTPGFGDTTDFVDIKRHYYEVHRDLNPLGIVPKGPELSDLLQPHGREALGGSPFGNGTAPDPVNPDPVEEGHRIEDLVVKH